MHQVTHTNFLYRQTFGYGIVIYSKRADIEYMFEYRLGYCDSSNQRVYKGELFMHPTSAKIIRRLLNIPRPWCRRWRSCQAITRRFCKAANAQAALDAVSLLASFARRLQGQPDFAFRAHRRVAVSINRLRVEPPAYRADLTPLPFEPVLRLVLEAHVQRCLKPGNGDPNDDNFT